MKILRKMIALVMVTIMAAMLFASCKPADETQTTPGASGTQSESNDPNAPAKPEKLTIWLQKTFSDEFNNAFAQLFQDFGKENGIAISTEIVDAAALRDTKLPAALEAKNYPNIAYMDLRASWPMRSRVCFAPRGYHRGNSRQMEQRLWTISSLRPMMDGVHMRYPSRRSPGCFGIERTS